MDHEKLAREIDEAWRSRSSLMENLDRARWRDAVLRPVLQALDEGRIRVTVPDPLSSTRWRLQEWVKQAILLWFLLSENRYMDVGHGGYDKIPLKWEGWSENSFLASGFRVAVGAIVRHGAYIAKNVVLMPSYVNIGSYIDEGTMVDSWVTVGSGAQIGKKCHLSSGVVIGGVLEPLQQSPVIVEDGCFIGANSALLEGVHVHQGAVLAAGVNITLSTKIIDRVHETVHYGSIPANAVVVPGSFSMKGSEGVHLQGAVIVKYVDEQTRSRTAINEFLREVVATVG